MLSSPQAVRDFLKHRLAGIPHELFVGILLDAQNRVLSDETQITRHQSPEPFTIILKEA